MKKYSVKEVAKNVSHVLREACKGEKVVITRSDTPSVKL
jgi:antitoxin (DNA-binding transcriptional repressor) of toxin-antitoxin stability system